jgi:GMP synthase-like glutamine amidotransferase
MSNDRRSKGECIRKRASGKESVCAMRALVIQPDNSELPGLVGQALGVRGFTIESFVIQNDVDDPGGRNRFPDTTAVDVVVITGSPWSVYDPLITGWVAPLQDLIRTRHASGRAVLGLCFGGQAAARALGGSVDRSPRAEFGWCGVTSRVPAIDGSWFQWHSDRFVPPERAEELASSDVACQAFRLGSVVGLQFHPEVDAEILDAWFATGGACELAESGIDVGSVAEHARVNAAHLSSRTDALVDWFLRSVVESR